LRIEKKTLLIHAVFPYYTTHPQNRKGGCGKFRNASQMDRDKRDWAIIGDGVLDVPPAPRVQVAENL
jgi:hypothetical protein